MSDDFLNDVNSAVSGTTESMTDIKADVVQKETVQQPAQQPVQQPQQQQTTSVADELSAMFDANDVSEIDTGIRKEPEAEKQEKVEKEQKKEAPSQQKYEKSDVKSEKWVDTYLQEDEKGNLVDKEGNIIAGAGKSRTIYEKLRKSARDYRDAANKLASQQYQLAGKFKELYEEYKGLSDKAVSSTQSIVRETGMTEREATDAINILKQFKSDPINAVKNILTQMHLNGIDTTQIGANITADPSTIRNSIEGLLNEKLTPIQESASQDLERRKAQEQVDNFFARFPEAIHFENAIGQAYQRYPNMSLDDIWLNLRKELVKNQEKARKQKSQKTPKRKRVARPQQKVSPKPVSTDYGKMSFDQIAQTVLEDIN